MSSRPSASVLIVGLGSAGRRHLRHLQALGVMDIRLLRSFRSTLPEDELAGLPVHTSLEPALAHRPDAVIIATPTALHLRTALPAARAGCLLLLEKPVSHSLEGIDDLRATGAPVLVGFQFRHHPTLRRLRDLLCSGAIGPVVHAAAEWGEYLPDWHPWEDHRRSYAARADLGGGVFLTLCHPFDYLRWLLGEVSEVSAMTSDRGGLGLDVEDTANVQLRFAGGALAQVHLDYLARPPRHRFHILGGAGALDWDAVTGVARCRRNGCEPEVFPPPQGFERETVFRDQMRHFLACLEGREQPQCTLEDGIAALRIVLAAKQSAAEGRAIAL